MGKGTRGQRSAKVKPKYPKTPPGTVTQNCLRRKWVKRSEGGERQKTENDELINRIVVNRSKLPKTALQRQASPPHKRRVNPPH